MDDLKLRLTNIIDLCWLSFSAKVGGGLIEINKEASMQLHFAYILKNSIDLIVHHQDESVSIELETGISVNGRTRECDIVVKVEKGDNVLYLPIEMKCYKTKSSSGGFRGAQDLLRLGIYEDLQLLEQYENTNVLNGFQLTMTDSRNFIFPKSKEFKSWDYDISEGTIITNGIRITTPIGGKEASIELSKSYSFHWKQVGTYYFLMLNGS